VETLPSGSTCARCPRQKRPERAAALRRDATRLPLTSAERPLCACFCLQDRRTALRARLTLHHTSPMPHPSPCGGREISENFYRAHGEPLN